MIFRLSSKNLSHFYFSRECKQRQNRFTLLQYSADLAGQRRRSTTPQTAAGRQTATTGGFYPENMPDLFRADLGDNGGFGDSSRVRPAGETFEGNPTAYLLWGN